MYKPRGKNKTELEKESRRNGVKYDFKIFALNLDREKLYTRINERVDKMIEQGLIDEVKLLLENYNEFPTAMQGLGYKEVVSYLENKLSKEEMIEKIKQDSRHYAKRQITWFKKITKVRWLDSEDNIQKNIDIIKSSL